VSTRLRKGDVTGLGDKVLLQKKLNCTSHGLEKRKKGRGNWGERGTKGWAQPRTYDA